MGRFQQRHFNKNNTWIPQGFVRILSRLIGKFVFDVSQIRSGRIEIRSGCIALTLTPLATDLNAFMIIYHSVFSHTQTYSTIFD
jgi:hypothetical protein